MSHVSLDQGDPDSDFWEFVVCTKCYLPYASDANLTVPFWLTECGHILCNNHLNADQSCAHCGSAGIQLAPLQRQMDAPMSDWFRSIPMALDGIAYAAKFQQETLASQIRYYKTRHLQYRNFIERLKRDVGDLKNMNQSLSSENDYFRQQLGNPRYSNSNQGQDPADFVNSNGKRPMIPSREYHGGSGRPQTNSSPRSIPTPLGPNRITLPPGQKAPELSSESRYHDVSTGSHSKEQRRPVSNRLIQQYAYVPPETPQFRPTQDTPKYFQRTVEGDNTSQRLQRQGLPPPSGQQQMPPSSSRFKPASSNKPNLPSASSIQTRRKQSNMGPPPTPQNTHRQPTGAFLGQQAQSIERRDSSNGASASIVDTFATTNRRFFPTGSAATQTQRPLDANSQRFFPKPASDSLASRQVQTPASGSRAPTNRASMPGGGQRMPFVPGASNIHKT